MRTMTTLGEGVVLRTETTTATQHPRCRGASRAERVPKLLGDMVVVSEAKKHKDMKNVASFKQRCKPQKVLNEKSISQADESIERLNADTALLSKEIAGHE